MHAPELIQKKRDGLALSEAELSWLVRAYTGGRVQDAQMAAFAMAVFFQGMNASELSALVLAMMHSGEVLSWEDLGEKTVDKHSTGGVGDKVSLCLAPLVASLGLKVPMISGRGLGHTGGTLDKLSAIPGFRVDASQAEFQRWVREIGLGLIGQTEAIAPADRKLYRLRDVTATVESVALISASIMSKKLAEGIDGLVLDVKVGSGAFMKTLEDAEALANTMIGIGASMGKGVRALLTNMDQVLGSAVGNANETWEAITVLKGEGPADLVELTVELGAEMLCLGDKAQSLDAARQALHGAISDGRGFAKLEAIVEAQGGDPRALASRDKLPMAQCEHVIEADRAGVIKAIETEAIGRAAVILGAGRARSDDVIDVSVGLSCEVKPGDRVEAGQPLVRMAYNDAAKKEAAEARIRAAISVVEPHEAPEAKPQILKRLGAAEA